jgi:mono/diheme cytochrome c family protein
MSSKLSKLVKQIFSILFVLLFALAAFSQRQTASQKVMSATDSKKIDFARDIQPIFEKNCLSCHSAKKAMGQLRLDDRRLAFKGGSSGSIILPGNSRNSLLIQRISGLGDQARMPLAGNPLSKIQIELIRAWIDQGAIWNDESNGSASQTTASELPKHWAYVKPVRRMPPDVKTRNWVRNPIDNFILARLEKESLKPSPEASKETLIRRLYFDLTGLPPTLSEVDEFLADSTPNAYEKLVDRLLASPHYGERWARLWLDLARFADTNGYEKDNQRVMWKYRDWLINALNNDMPFNQFTIEQIAGDMLPNATIDQKIATGFHRNTLLNQEGGIDPEEARWEVNVDRVSTTATVWMGTTLGCAQCHNHKYDPFTQKDFYRMFAFFDNSEYRIDGKPLERWVKEPTLYLPTAEQAIKRDTLNQEIAKLEETLKTPTPELEKQQAEWEHQIKEAANQWITIEPLTFSATSAALKKLEDNSLLASGEINPRDVYTITAKTDLTGITAIRLEAIPDESLPGGGPGRDVYGNFALYGFDVQISSANPPAKKEPVVFIDASSDDGPVKNLLKKDSGSWWIEATNDAIRMPRQAVFIAQTPFGDNGGTYFEIKLKHNNPTVKQTIGRFRFSVTTTNKPADITSITAKLRPVLNKPVEVRSKEEKSTLAQYYFSIAPALKPVRERLDESRKALAALNILTAEVMGEKPSYERPFTYLRNRGSFTNVGEKIYAGVPASLHPLPENQMPNRLGLAYWLVDSENPLVARVTVNRFWEQFFGRGIVETSEDFGTQSQPPSHGELLDWLATEFMRGKWGLNKWSMKAIHRLIVTSATYRQSSTVTTELLERDPYNRLLARGARFRLEAEMIRDLALATSGLLSRKIGGPSVFPLQPEGVWNTPYSSDRWKPSPGEDRFRRGIYTFIRRTAPYPMFTTFDAPSREQCTVRRVRTNTPLQALTTLNDEAFFVAARAIAKRMTNAGNDNLQTRISYGFRLCTSRQPTTKELERLTAFYQQQLEKFGKDLQAAKALLKEEENSLSERQTAEMAALTMVANVLLNLDETLTKE